MADIDPEALRRVAEAAAEAWGDLPWSSGTIGWTDPHGTTYEVKAAQPSHQDFSQDFHVADAACEELADHIATLDPPTVLALLDRLAAAEAESEDLRSGRYCPVCGRHYQQVAETTPGAPCAGCGRYPAAVLTVDMAARLAAAEGAVARVREVAEGWLTNDCEEGSGRACSWHRVAAECAAELTDSLAPTATPQDAQEPPESAGSGGVDVEGGGEDDPRECGWLGCGHPACGFSCAGVPLATWRAWKTETSDTEGDK